MDKIQSCIDLVRKYYTVARPRSNFNDNSENNPGTDIHLHLTFVTFSYLFVIRKERSESVEECRRDYSFMELQFYMRDKYQRRFGKEMARIDVPIDIFRKNLLQIPKFKYYEAEDDPVVQRIGEFLPDKTAMDIIAIATKIWHLNIIKNMKLDSSLIEIKLSGNKPNLSELTGFTPKFLEYTDVIKHPYKCRSGSIGRDQLNQKLITNFNFTDPQEMFYGISNFLHEPLNESLLFICKKSRYKSESLFEVLKSIFDLNELYDTRPKVILKLHTIYQGIVKYPDNILTDTNAVTVSKVPDGISNEKQSELNY
jgi:hypothetical protein